MRLVVETENKAINTIDGAIKLYSNVLDRIVPWKAFNETMVNLKSFKDKYSEQSAELVAEIRALLMEGISAYHRATQFIFEWANETIPLLTAYIELFDDYTANKAEKQKNILIEMLAKGAVEMKQAQAAITESSMSFNRATGKLTTLNTQFQIDSDEKSTYFKRKVDEMRLIAANTIRFGPFMNALMAILNEVSFVPRVKKRISKSRKFFKGLRLKVEQAFRDVDVTKDLLNNEILEIGDLKVQTKETGAFIDLDAVPELRDTLVKSAQNLIQDCNDYRRKHTKNANQ